MDVPAVAPAANPLIATATASHAGSAPHKGKAPVAPPPSQSSGANAYPSGLGHRANQGLGGPLQLVPFDLSESHRYPNGFTINPYSGVDQIFMGSLWTRSYAIIPDEPAFQSEHVLRYLHKFYAEPSVLYPTIWDTTVDFSRTPFYISLGMKFTDLDIVKSVRDHDIELKGSKHSSQVASMTSMKLGAIQPDVCLRGYRIGNFAERTYREEPAGGGDLRITDHPLEVLYAQIELKWVPWPEGIELELHLKDLEYANMEAIVQTVFYSLLGYDVSKCRSAIAM
ncbi:hypothetical protein B9479_007590, partial [Cryptococcus floricola]